MVENSVRLFLVALLLLAAGEKLVELLRRTDRWHPLIIQSPFRRRHSALLFAGSALTEVAIAGAILGGIQPYAGYVAGALILSYSWLAVTTPGNRRSKPPCRCVHRLLDAPTVSALVLRNSLIVILTLYAAGGDSPVAITAESVALCLTLLAFISVLMRLFIPFALAGNHHLPKQSTTLG